MEIWKEEQRIMTRILGFGEDCISMTEKTRYVVY